MGKIVFYSKVVHFGSELHWPPIKIASFLFIGWAPFNFPLFTFCPSFSNLLVSSPKAPTNKYHFKRTITWLLNRPHRGRKLPVLHLPCHTIFCRFSIIIKQFLDSLFPSSFYFC